jgi:hypothetical protein
VRWPPARKLVICNSELILRQSPDIKEVNTETEEATALEAVTWRQLMKIQQIEKFLYML